MAAAIQLLVALLFSRVVVASGTTGLAGPLAPPMVCVALLAAVRVGGRWAEARLRKRAEVARGDPEAWEHLVLEVHRREALLQTLPLMVAALAAAAGGWAVWWERYGLGGLPLVDEVGLLLPFGGAQSAYWRHRWCVERLLLRRLMPWGRYLSFQVRQLLLPVLPVLLLLGLWDFLEASPRLLRWVSGYAFLTPLAVGLVLAGLFCYSGPVVALLFGARPLPAGPLRDRLVRFAAGLGFRCREFLVWPTGVEAINAAIVGGAPRWRYVLFTDGMLRHFGPDTLEAVLAHEIGHAAGRHLPLYFVFALALLFLWSSLFDAAYGVLPELAASPWAEVALFAAVLFVYWRVVFGVVSRRFEREADLFAVRRLGDPYRFVAALEEIARKSGTVRTLPSWRHHSIAARSAFLLRALAEPSVARAFRRGTRRVKWAVVLLGVVGLVLAVRDAPAQVRAGHAFVEALAALEAGRPRAARRLVRELLAEPAAARRYAQAVAGYAPLVPADGPAGVARLLYADLLLRQGEEEEAAAALRPLLGRVEALVEGGSTEAARRLLGRILRFRRSWGAPAAGELRRLRHRVRAALAGAG